MDRSCRGDGEKGETQFSMDNKKNNVGRETESEEESSFGSPEQFVFRDSFALIQSGFCESRAEMFVVNCLDWFTDKSHYKSPLARKTYFMWR